jgi:ribA/ribD-fused uncharacterized protein
MAEAPITSFSGEFDFLSNFYEHIVVIDGESYATNEHAFQALKTDDPTERKMVRDAPSPGEAKQRGSQVTLRRIWNTERLAVMERVVRAKFTDGELAAKLLATGNRELIEGNTWNDRFWGCVEAHDGTWQGQNNLGNSLIRIRAEFQSGRKLGTHLLGGTAGA